MATTNARRPSSRTNDGHSSGSDDDRDAVEVLFDTSNPYRRKSSMPSSSVIPLHLRQRSSSKTECIVHQFLEGQRWARHPSVASAAAAASAQHESYNRHADDDSSIAVHREGSRPRSPSPAGDISSEWGLDDVPDLKGAGAASAVSAATAAGSNSGGQKSLRCDILDGDSSETSNGGPGGGIGQLDEREWKAQIVKTTSEIDLSASTAAAAAAAGGGGSPAQEVQSRLLTKRQLSDMAWGVRELSRRLGSVRLRFRVKSIFILTKIHDRDLVHKARQLTRWLLDRDRDVRYIVYVERDLKDNKLFDAAGLVDEVRRDFAAAHDDGEASDGASAADVARRLRYWDEGMCRARPHTFDFVITLGGDGTVLYASWLFQRIVPPVLSFALGSLGFLTKFDFEDHQHILTGAFTEGVSVSLRLRFEGTVMRSQRRRKKRQQHPNLLTDGGEKEETDDDDDDDNTELERQRDLVEELIGEEKEDEHTHRPDGTFEVLNEIVVDRGPNPTMSSIEIFGDDEHFTSVSADGVCVSTPTGSTAYNLAAGGSLCHPENPVMLVTSICAHTLSFRPIILPDTIVLRLGVPHDARTSSWASFDGRERVELAPGDYVTISASRYPFACVQAHGRRSEDWINSISAKLGWNTRTKQKAFTEWGK